MTITVVLPVRVVLAKNKETGKKYYLNLNEYRNAHYRALAHWKREFSSYVEPIMAKSNAHLKAIARTGPLLLTYTVYPFQKVDAANVACIVDKFFCDVLQDWNIIPNDDHTHIDEVRYRYGHADRSNPRCEVKIEAVLTR